MSKGAPTERARVIDCRQDAVRAVRYNGRRRSFHVLFFSLSDEMALIVLCSSRWQLLSDMRKRQNGKVVESNQRVVAENLRWDRQ
ncbi:hypothetical protein Y032_0323g2485 [Ancylostoma ceylanicum]|uniref:Uncharacterized protein n=1 Tax=Ancylostoma ceylanicum TaxID=53326 RepID=A0A016S192_9BILA|nr:hypothetical protein Y032_0323g2485 [Ancylostoma ceylanicum]